MHFTACTNLWEGLDGKVLTSLYTSPLPHPKPHSVERKGHGRGVRAANLIARDDVKFCNILSKYGSMECL